MMDHTYLGIEMHLIIRIVLALIIKWDNLLSVPAHISVLTFWMARKIGQGTQKGKRLKEIEEVEVRMSQST